MTEPLAQPGATPGSEPGKNQMDPHTEEAMRRANMLAMRSSGSFDSMLRGTRVLDRTDTLGPENAEIHERKLERNYERLVFSTLEQHLNVSTECLEWRNPYATWVSKPGRDLLDGMLAGLRDEYFLMTQKRDLEGKEVSPRREAWLKRMYADLSWMRASYAQQEGVGHLMKYYFSGPDMMLNALYEQRLNPTSDHFRKTYRNDVPELEMTPEQKEQVHRLLLEKTGGEPGEMEYGVGIRERAIKMQDDRFHHVVGVGQVGQIDWNEVDSTGGIPNWDAYLANNTMDMKLTANEINAYIALFGKGTVNYANHQVPKEVMNWFTIEETHSNKAEYKALMEALVLENAREQIIGASNGAELDAVIRVVRERANKLVKKELDLNLEEKLARTIVRGGIVTDLAHGYSLKLGWGYKHGDGRREVGFSGIYNGMDTYTVGWPFHHDLIYDMRASKRAGLPPPTNAYYRNYMSQFPPTQWPDMLWGENGAVNRDPRLKKAMDYLFGQGPDGEAFWRENNLSLKPQDAEILKELLWGWGTGWDSDQVKGFNYAGLQPKPGQGPESVESKQTFFALAIPPEIGILLFENSVKLEGHKDENGFDMTMWEELMRGGENGEPLDLSEIKYNDMKPDAFDRWHVDMNMLGRVVSTLVDPLKEDFRKQFFEGPGQLKELLKRLYLGLRDEVVKIEVGDPENRRAVQVPGPLLWCAYASTLISWYVSNDKNLVSKFYKDSTSQTSFVKNLTEWIQYDLWMPGDIPGFDNFSGTLGLMTFFAAYQMNYIGKDPKGGGDDLTMYTKAAGVVKPISK